MTRQPWRRVCPEIFEQFDVIEAIARAAVDPAIAIPVQRAIAENLRSDREINIFESALDPASDVKASVAVRFAEQFVMDVANVSEELRAELGMAFGASTFEFVQAVYVYDIFQRARVGFGRMFSAAWEHVDVDLPEGVSLWSALEQFMRSVALLNGLDPVTTELVRLRGAMVHQCRLCSSRRSVAAVDAVGDAVGGAGIFNSVGEVALSEPRHQVAVDFADVLVTQPWLLDDALVARVHATFDHPEIVEIILDVVRNAANKIAVAFGADAPNVTSGIEYFAIDMVGDVIASVDLGSLRTP